MTGLELLPALGGLLTALATYVALRLRYRNAQLERECKQLERENALLRSVRPAPAPVDEDDGDTPVRRRRGAS